MKNSKRYRNPHSCAVERVIRSTDSISFSGPTSPYMSRYTTRRERPAMWLYHNFIIPVCKMWKISRRLRNCHNCAVERVIQSTDSISFQGPRAHICLDILLVLSAQLCDHTIISSFLSVKYEIYTSSDTFTLRTEYILKRLLHFRSHPHACRFGGILFEGFDLLILQSCESNIYLKRL